MLRIDCKRLRYALEFFATLLGPRRPGVIKQVTAMQELLGAMQDAHVAEGLIVEFLTEQPSRKKAEPHAGRRGVPADPAADPGRTCSACSMRRGPRSPGLDFRRSLGLALATP